MNIIQLKNQYIKEITDATNKAIFQGFPAFAALYCVKELQNALMTLDQQQSKEAELLASQEEKDTQIDESVVECTHDTD